MSRIFVISVTLGQAIFADLPIISQWAKIKLSVISIILSLCEWSRDFMVIFLKKT